MELVEVKYETVVDETTGESIDYTINIYDNGATEKFDSRFPPKIVEPPILTEDQEILREVATNIEMMEALSELEKGGVEV